ncbi:hypothetical protein [Archangium lipolyticum]|uniref:hypothetical protein n=1 Tax=Archangium lipolyticum TaxID=2970465 RepID=UPI002149B9B5|nr:hypothetical protein [Archangium lipolyticum]
MTMMTRAAAALAFMMLLVGCPGSPPDDGGRDGGMDPDAGPPVELDGECPVNPSYRSMPSRECLPKDPAYVRDGGGYVLADGGQPYLFGTWVPVPEAGGGGFSLLAYDPVRDQVVAVGQGSTWTFDGARWSKLAATTPADFSSLTFDPRRQQLVALDTAASEGPQTYAWDGTSWRNLQIQVDPGSKGAPSGLGVMRYDASRQRIVFFADGLATWELDETWSLKDEVGPGFGHRQYAGLVFDCRHGELLLVAGSGVQGLPLWDWYAWTDSGWQAKDSELPFPHKGPAVFDTEYGDVVAFANEVVSSYDGDWCAGKTAPQQAHMRHVVYDIHHRRYVGIDWNGGTWTLHR